MKHVLPYSHLRSNYNYQTRSQKYQLYIYYKYNSIHNEIINECKSIVLHFVIKYPVIVTCVLKEV